MKQLLGRHHRSRWGRLQFDAQAHPHGDTFEARRAHPQRAAQMAVVSAASLKSHLGGVPVKDDNLCLLAPLRGFLDPIPSTVARYYDSYHTTTAISLTLHVIRFRMAVD